MIDLLTSFCNDNKILNIKDNILNKERLSLNDALYLYENADLTILGILAHFIRQQKHNNKTYFNHNFHIEPTNVCLFTCDFCSYSRTYAKRAEGWELTLEQMLELVDKHPPGSVTEVHIVGGVHPKMNLYFFGDLIEKIKSKRPELHIKAFTAVELDYMFKKAKLSIEDGFKYLISKGLQSIPGGGAEIFDSVIRKQICADKVDAQGWLLIHETAHKLGLKSNATILYGHIENYRHRLEHLELLRQLQDKTHGFQTIIPLKFRNQNNQMSHIPELSLIEDLKMYAMTRIFMDNFDHVKAYWPMLGRFNAQLCLQFGVDDLDGTIENSTEIYAMAGSEESKPNLSRNELIQLIEGANCKAVERDSLYNELNYY